MLNDSIPKEKRFRVPEGLTGGQSHPEILAVGPFVMTIDGRPLTGMHLFWNGTEYVMSTGSRAIVIDDTYTYNTVVQGDTVTFTSARYDSVIVLRPLLLSDAEWIFRSNSAWRSPDAPPITLEELRQGILASLAG